MHESVHDKTHTNCMAVWPTKHIPTVWQCGLQNTYKLYGSVAYKTTKWKKLALIDTFLVSSFSLRTLIQSLAVSNITSIMAQISAFSMSFEPASPVCVHENHLKRQSEVRFTDHLIWWLCGWTKTNIWVANAKVFCIHTICSEATTQVSIKKSKWSIWILWCIPARKSIFNDGKYRGIVCKLTSSMRHAGEHISFKAHWTLCILGEMEPTFNRTTIGRVLPNLSARKRAIPPLEDSFLPSTSSTGT